MNALDGPWQVSPDVAWVDSGEIHILALRAPYSALPWRLTGSAGAIWEGVADGLTRSQLLSQLGDMATPHVVAQIDRFVRDLLARDLIRPDATDLSERAAALPGDEAAR